MADYSLSVLDKLTRAITPTGAAFDGPHTVNIVPIAGGAPTANTSSLSVWDKLSRALSPTGASLLGDYTLNINLSGSTYTPVAGGAVQFFTTGSTAIGATN